MRPGHPRAVCHAPLSSAGRRETVAEKNSTIYCCTDSFPVKKKKDFVGRIDVHHPPSSSSPFARRPPRPFLNCLAGSDGDAGDRGRSRGGCLQPHQQGFGHVQQGAAGSSVAGPQEGVHGRPRAWAVAAHLARRLRVYFLVRGRLDCLYRYYFFSSFFIVNCR